ncbi:hypothetical protein L798_00419 [Zootermopsis nevadensis]|uniref:Uncharacterized protein n=1 Tax=Zootermopsis nevadensis TaxID=136037 RepID=A0A067QXV3_ZOONE|nr:hypothetical protein L798_00419 [Zootermopsis nevadensis]
MIDAWNMFNNLLKLWVLFSNLKKDTQNSKTISKSSCLTTVGVLVLVPVHQVKLK